MRETTKCEMLRSSQRAIYIYRGEVEYALTLQGLLSPLKEYLVSKTKRTVTNVGVLVVTLTRPPSQLRLPEAHRPVHTGTL